MNKKIRIVVKPEACLLFALMVLLLPVQWYAGLLAAAAVHETAHILMLKWVGGKVLALEIGCGGAIIDTDVLTPGQELVSALAGPVGSFSLLLIKNWAPMAASFGVIQGLFNLLPIYPMDGGRVLRCAAELFLPPWGKKAATWVERGTGVLLAGSILILWFRTGGALIPAIAISFILTKLTSRKTLAKIGI